MLSLLNPWVTLLYLLFIIILYFTVPRPRLSVRLSAFISCHSLMAYQYGHAPSNFLLLTCSRLESQIVTLFRTVSKKGVKRLS